VTRFKVQVVVTKPGWVGLPWKTVRAFKNRATAEHVAKYMERDGEMTRVLQSDRVQIIREQTLRERAGVARS
jgi:hypothetical protein